MRAGHKLEEGRSWGASRLLRQRAALAEAGVVVEQITVLGTKLRVARKEGVGPPLLLCNGIGANFEMLLPFVSALGDRRVLLFDVPGTGGSDDTWMMPRMRNYSRYARRVLDHFGEKRAHVAGISWGGLLAQRVALDAPDRVLSLVLMATTTGIVMLPGRIGALLLMLTPQRYFSRGFMVRNAHTIYGGEVQSDPELAIEHSQMVRAPSLLGYVQQLGAVRYFSSLPWLWRVHCPALVLAGDDDPLIRVANARVLAKCLPKGKLQVIRGGGHLFANMQAEKTAGLVVEFMAKAESAS